jgi:hypothetical protein
MYVIVPLWLAVGLGDWLCHRVTQIERNAGTKESVLHLLMLAEIGVPVLIVLFFEVNATVITIMLAALLVHELTAWWDVSYASTRRHISTVEQHMHSFMEVLPFTALALVLVNHWGQLLALFGFGAEPPVYSLQWKAEPLPLWYRAALIVAILLLAVLPYLEELRRCLRSRRRNIWQ